LEQFNYSFRIKLAEIPRIYKNTLLIGARLREHKSKVGARITCIGGGTRAGVGVGEDLARGVESGTGIKEAPQQPLALPYLQSPPR